MFTTLLAALSLAPPAAPACDLHHASPKLAAIIEASWADDAQSKAELNHQKDVKADKELGKKYSELAEKELKLSKDTAMLERLQRIGAELAAIANETQVSVTWGDKRLSKFDYSFKLVEDKDVNAFSLPGGYIYFNDGLMKYAESDDEIAGVVAHEIAHAALRHVATLQREQEKVSAIQLPLIIAAILSGNSETIGSVLTGSSLVGAAKSSGWSVKAEQAADFGGFQYLIKSNFDPTGMLTFMERLARDERSKPFIDWGIFRTHPPGRERADSLNRYMRDAGIPIRRSRVAETFRATAKQVAPDKVELLFGGRFLTTIAGAGAVDRSGVVIERLNNFFDSMPELYDISTGDGGEILGRKQTLLTITTTDAAALNKQVKDLQQETVGNLRSALYSIAYRVWDAR
jgi:predicted Zn-dependent protease